MFKGGNLWYTVGHSGKIMVHFFSGSHKAKLDSKNRFVLPQNMRYGLVEDGELRCSLGLGLGGCLTIYKRKDIELIAEKFQKKQHIAKYQKFFTTFFSTLYHTECDKIGRITIPGLLKAAVGMKQEIVVAGVLNKIELWPQEVYEANLQKVLQGGDPNFDLSKLAEEAFALLDEDESVTDE